MIRAAIVWGLFFVECLAAAFSAHAAWHTLGAGWGDLEVLIKPIWSFTALPPLCGFGEIVYLSGLTTLSSQLPSRSDRAIILLLEDIRFREEHSNSYYHRCSKLPRLRAYKFT
jgi:hypothetical protein